jgi:predicted nucleic acid-binding protein
MGYPTVDLDEALVREAASRLADADREAGGDSGIGVNHAYVAAVAASYDEPVLTENVADFKALGVEVETY